jgi:hypothetical protein
MAIELHPMAAIESIGLDPGAIAEKIDPRAIVERLDPRHDRAHRARRRRRNRVLLLVAVVLGAGAVAVVLRMRRAQPETVDLDPVDALLVDGDVDVSPALRRHARGA